MLKTASFPAGRTACRSRASPGQWTKLLKDTDLADITPHVLRHSFASIGNDLGFTEATIAALVGHSRGTVTSRYSARERASASEPRSPPQTRTCWYLRSTFSEVGLRRAQSG
ncbi:tyrosine-type recombinase/integrase [Mesorhizobium sp. CA4]|uniref:tyrosine-type recombinase/integrase n=1 Tax=Mesorhizobium sp. CA4 TaxID=588499 RepID=UPI00398CAB1E